MCDMKQIPWNILSGPTILKRLGNKLANRDFQELQDDSRAISSFPGVKTKAITTPAGGKVLRPCLALTPVSPPQAQSHVLCRALAIWEGKHKRNTPTPSELLPKTMEVKHGEIFGFS